VQLEVVGLEGESLLVVLRSEGLEEGDETSLEVTEDGRAPFPADLECGAGYSLSIESAPPDRTCRLASDVGTSGPDRVHRVECFTRPAACEGLFVEPPQRVRFEDALGPGLPLSERDIGVTSLVRHPNDPDVWYAGTMQGGVFRYADGEWTEVLDIRPQVDSEGEDGFLSLVLAPDFPDDPRLFVHYVYEEPDPRRIMISRFTLRGDGPEFDLDSELPVLEVRKSPDRNSHAGGTLHFGPDGMLWGSIGDGGVTDDPPDNAQDVSTLLGTMFRVDVSGAEPYVSPPDNPFGPDGERPGEGRPEIWAWGMRNPYRWSFDALTGEAWGGDVGHVTWEEINHYERGRNYGWPVREGPTCFGSQDDACPSDGFTPPVHAYAQEVGEAVIGGGVYRGAAIPELYGAYLFGDFGSRELRAILDPYDTRQVVELGELPIAPVSFATDADGEVLALGFSGRIVRLVGADAGEDLPATIDATGCLRDGSTELAPAFVPYDVASPLWSDGAEKGRWLALPEGTAATVGDDGDLALPVGAVVAKDFTVDGRLLETRFLLHRAPGQWVGYSYRWEPDGSEARLVTAGMNEDLGDQTWFYPGPSDCGQCHTEAAGRSLGLELRQLAGVIELDGAPSPQLPYLVANGVLESAPTATPFPALDDDAAPLADRARAYLHANCSHCHRPENPIRVELDLRFTTPLAETGVCAEPLLDDLGLTDPQIVAPGAPDRSVLLARMRSLGPERMPRLATSVVDEAAVGVVEAWIAGLASCE